jgi:hypothetical protein
MDLTAFWSIEKNPQRQVAGEVFEAMHAAGRGEKNIRWPKRLSPIVADIFASARCHKVDFVSRVRCLWIITSRRIDLDQQTAVLKDSGEALTFRAGQTLERTGNSRSDAGIV